MVQNELKNLRIGVLMGGLSAEREVSLETGQAVLAALGRRQYSAIALDVDRNISRRLEDEAIQVAFIALHGKYGEDGCIQGVLETLGIPYTASGVLASALAMDKVQTKRLLEAAKIPTAAWCFPATPEAILKLGLPVVIKPRNEGSSVGLTVAQGEQDLVKAVEKAGGASYALAERYIKGKELTAAVLGSGQGARCLGTLEIRAAGGVYDYEAKYQRDDTQYLVPAPVPEKVEKRLKELALKVHRLLDCRGATRTDFIWDGQGEPCVLELNTIPGMTGHSLLPKIAQFTGMSYDDLVEEMLLEAALEVKVS